MSRYPDTPRPIVPYPFRNNRPAVSGGPDWTAQSRALTRFGLGECDLTYRGKTWAQVAQIYSFFDSIGGSAGRFTFVDFNGAGVVGGSDPGVPWKALFVVQGDGSAAGPWDMPTYAIQASQTTVASGLTAGAGVVVTPASMSGIVSGCSLTAVNADGTNGEEVAVTSATATTFTATFTADKASSWLINAPLVFENGVAKQTVIASGIPGSEPYSIKVGYGTDGVDALYAFVAPADGVIVTVSALCRRAFRRARVTNAKAAFSYNNVGNYSGDVITITEVRK